VTAQVAATADETLAAKDVDELLADEAAWGWLEADEPLLSDG